MDGGNKIWRKKREEEQEAWITAQGRKRQGTQTEDHVWISTSNRFSVLESEGEEEKKEVRSLMFGDSRARPLMSMFSEKDRCVVKPGALVSHIDATIQEEFTRYDPEMIIVQVGVNNVGPRRSVELMKNYSALLHRLKEARKPAVVTGILPRAVASREWYSRALSANASGKELCSKIGLHFVDLWDEFY